MSDCTEISMSTPGAAGAAGEHAPPAMTSEITVSSVRQILRARQRRASFFRSSLFADPAWDMLLELYAAEREQRRISVSSLTIASGVPATTALRWIKILEDEGLIERHPDRFDRRRVFVHLTPGAINAMQRYFQSTRVALRFDRCHLGPKAGNQPDVQASCG